MLKAAQISKNGSIKGVRVNPDASFSVLGPLEVRLADRLVEIGGRRLRALLTLLLLDTGNAVPIETLIAGVWGDHPPAGVGNALQALVSRLRTALDRGGPGAKGLVRAEATGYRLLVPPDQVDVHRFGRLAATGRAALDAGDAATARDAFGAALALWRGPALADLAGHDAEVAQAEIRGLEEARLSVTEGRIEADLRLGRHDEVVPELSALITAHPLRERLRALHMRALYDAGRQVEALAAYQQARETFADRLGADPSPELTALHTSMLRGEPPLHPADGRARVVRPAERPPAGRELRGNLRARLTSFVGRDREVAELGRLLAERRLVTLVGPGGAGKTRLALEVGDADPARTADGVWLVELAPVRDGQAVPDAALDALGGRDGGLRKIRLVSASSGPTAFAPAAHRGDGDVQGRLAALLTGSEALIILDNCEHVVDAAAGLADRLLADCPGVRVLATSREPLGIIGETLFAVAPLESPPAGLVPSAIPPAGAGPEVVSDAAGMDELRRYPAVRLFLDRAAGVRPGLDVGPPDTVARICRTLDGLPLAIELAAARLRSMSTRQIADRLGDRFRLLTAGSRTALPRHQTLRAVVAWSWDLLDARERALARRLAVFRGGATLAAAETVTQDLAEDPAKNPAGNAAGNPAANASGGAAGTFAGTPGGGLAQDDVLDVLTRLVDKSLVVMEDRDGRTRYRMLETIAAYARERLAEAGEENTYGLAHARYLLELAENAEPHLRRGEQVHWLRELAAEHDNLTAALHWTLTHGRLDLAIRLGGALIWYWWLLGHRAEGARWCQEIVTRAEAGGLASHAQDVDPAGLALVHASYAINAAGADAGFGEVRHSLLEVARLTEGHTGPRHPGITLAVPILKCFTGEMEEAERLLGDLVDDEDTWVASVAHTFLANLRLNFGGVDAAAPHALAALNGFRELGDRWGMGLTLSAIAEIAGMRGDFGRVIEMLTEAVSLIGEIGGHDDLPYLRLRLAVTLYQAGERARAEEQLAEAERVALERHNPGDLAYVRHLRGEFARWDGDLKRAATEHAAAMDGVARVPMVPPQQLALMQVGAGTLAMAERDAPRARELIAAALKNAVHSQDGPVLATCAVALAGLAALEGEPERAARLVGAAHAIRGLNDLGDPDERRIAETAKAALGPRYETEHERGRALSRDDAIELLERSAGRR
jgi:predicted ATPase/DNA-binding SARP family transcriptional activator